LRKAPRTRGGRVLPRVPAGDHRRRAHGARVRHRVPAPGRQLGDCAV